MIVKNQEKYQNFNFQGGLGGLSGQGEKVKSLPKKAKEIKIW